MKRLNKKGFSLVELLGAIVIMGVLTTVTIVGYSRYIDKSKKNSYQTMIQSARHAMDEYRMDHVGAQEATFNELFTQEYLEKPTDPSDKKQLCRGKVIVEENDDDDDEIDGAIEEVEYTVIICCANYNHTITSAGLDTVDTTCQA